MWKAFEIVGLVLQVVGALMGAAFALTLLSVKETGNVGIPISAKFEQSTRDKILLGGGFLLICLGAAAQIVGVSLGR